MSEDIGFIGFILAIGFLYSFFRFIFSGELFTMLKYGIMLYYCTWLIKDEARK